MGLSLATLVYFAMNLYRVYAPFLVTSPPFVRCLSSLYSFPYMSRSYMQYYVKCAELNTRVQLKLLEGDNFKTYHMYAALFKMSGAKTIAEILSNSNTWDGMFKVGSYCDTVALQIRIAESGEKGLVRTFNQDNDKQHQRE
eukprot:2312-Pyramimonas_sp.AAC.1